MAALSLTTLHSQIEIVSGIQILANLISYLTVTEKDKRNIKDITVELARILKISSTLLEFYHMEPSEEEAIVEYATKHIPPEIQIDPILSLNEMLEDFCDIMYVVNVKVNPPVWAEEEVPEELEIDFLTIEACIYNICNKLKIKQEDLFDQVLKLK